MVLVLILNKQLGKHSRKQLDLTDLPIETNLAIAAYLDHESLSRLARGTTCTLFRKLLNIMIGRNLYRLTVMTRMVSRICVMCLLFVLNGASSSQRILFFGITKLSMLTYLMLKITPMQIQNLHAEPGRHYLPCEKRSGRLACS